MSINIQHLRVVKWRHVLVCERDCVVVGGRAGYSEKWQAVIWWLDSGVSLHFCLVGEREGLCVGGGGYQGI